MSVIQFDICSQSVRLFNQEKNKQARSFMNYVFPLLYFMLTLW